ncbi:MAG: AbrB family transcriptional regulator [Candidatus Micrarchaeota archaeon]
MVSLHADSKCRVNLTQEVIQEFGRDYELVRTRTKLLLIPISKDPLKSLQEQGKKIPAHLTINDLKRIAREDAEKEALSNLKRR